MYGPYIRIYGWSVPGARIYGPYIWSVQKKLDMQCFSALRPVYTHSVYRSPVYTGRRAVLAANENFPCILCGDVIDVIYNVIAIFLLFTVCIFLIVVIFELKWKILAKS